MKTKNYALFAIFLLGFFLQPAYGQLQNIGNDTKKDISHEIIVNGTTFTVAALVDSGAQVKDIELDVSSKTLAIDFEKIENLEKLQFMTIVFDRVLLGGPFTVMFDDKVVVFKEDYFYAIKDKMTIFVITFPAKTERISIIGTTVAPEFPYSLAMVAVSTSIVLLMARFSNKLNLVRR